MLLTAIVLLSLLFISSLLYTTLLNSQTKNKLMAWPRSLLTRALSQHVETNPTCRVHQKEEIRSGTHKKAELKNVFDTFDKNKDGFITKWELRESMGNIGIHMDEREAADMVEKVDSNGDGLIDFEEFCELFEAVVGGEKVAVVGGGGGGEGDLMKEAFDVFDGDRDGLITVEELGLVLSSLGMKEGERVESCKEMIRKVDADGDGMVNFDEFRMMMKAAAGAGGVGRLIAVS